MPKPPRIKLDACVWSNRTHLFFTSLSFLSFPSIFGKGMFHILLGLTPAMGSKSQYVYTVGICKQKCLEVRREAEKGHHRQLLPHLVIPKVREVHRGFCQ